MDATKSELSKLNEERIKTLLFSGEIDKEPIRIYYDSRSITKYEGENIFFDDVISIMSPFISKEVLRFSINISNCLAEGFFEFWSDHCNLYDICIITKEFNCKVENYRGERYEGKCRLSFQLNGYRHSISLLPEHKIPLRDKSNLFPYYDKEQDKFTEKEGFLTKAAR